MISKSHLAFLLGLFLRLSASAQTDTVRKYNGSVPKIADTIVKRNGGKTAVELLEVNTENLVYKRFDYRSGPIFTISKTDIAYIIYGNGKRESFELSAKPLEPAAGSDLTIMPDGWRYFYRNHYITEPDMLDVASQLHNKNLDLLIDKVEKRRVWHTVTLLSGIFIIGDGLYLIATNRSVRYHPGGIVTGNTPAQQHVNRNIGRILILGGLATEGVTIHLRFNRRKYSHLVMDAYNKDISR
jgi:hypothetical protein